MCAAAKPCFLATRVVRSGRGNWKLQLSLMPTCAWSSVCVVVVVTGSPPQAKKSRHQRSGFGHGSRQIHTMHPLARSGVAKCGAMLPRRCRISPTSVLHNSTHYSDLGPAMFLGLAPPLPSPPARPPAHRAPTRTPPTRPPVHRSTRPPLHPPTAPPAHRSTVPHVDRTRSFVSGTSVMARRPRLL